MPRWFWWFLLMMVAAGLALSGGRDGCPSGQAQTECVP